MAHEKRKLEEDRLPYIQLNKDAVLSAIKYCAQNNPDICKTHASCLDSSLDRLKDLLYCGYSIDYEDLKEQMPLICAAQVKNFPVIEFLLQNENIDINQTDDQGRLFLHVLFEENALEQMLLDVCKGVVKNASFKINTKDQSGNTLLLYAAKRCNTKMLELILDRNDIDVQTFDIILRDYVMYESVKIMEKMFRIRKYSITCFCLRAVIRNIAVHGDITVFKHLYGLRNEIEFRLNEVTSMDKETVMGFLAAVTISLDIRDCSYILTECLKYVSVHWQCTKGQTLLHKFCLNPSAQKEASFYFASNIINLLCNKGIDVNIQDDDRQTALMVAIQQKLPSKLIERLAKHPSYDLTLTNVHDQTVLMIYESMPDDYRNSKITSLLNPLQHKENDKLNKEDIPLLDMVGQLRRGIEMADFQKEGEYYREYLLQQVSCFESDLSVPNQIRFTNEIGMLLDHQKKLIAKRVYLCKHLIFNSSEGILNHLLGKEIIDFTLFEQINQITDRLKQVELLLSILPLKGPNAYPSFIHALRETEQGFIADELENYDPNESVIPSQSEACSSAENQLVQFNRFGKGVLFQNIPGAQVQILPDGKAYLMLPLGN